MAVSSLTASMAVSSVPAYLPPTGMGGKYAAYVTTASLTVGDVVHLTKIPNGACMVDMLLSVDGNTAGAQLKVNVGDRADPDRYFDSQSIASGIVYRMNSTGLGYRYSAGSTTSEYLISLSVDTGSSLSTSLTIKLMPVYMTENWK